jgi:hypothetical protein
VDKMIRDRLASLADDELLAYERERHGDPYMTVADSRASGTRTWSSGTWARPRSGSRSRDD